ncbi:hypothetical protein EVAR_67613_1 [Eumeta japonica]|uniref:Uncharacterized protein n=1 Tax=Eumeta variegata TaxID=151549 RepID=A0A4C2A5A9_EUMVA|nr:hypothetical protein EVAR_67613_1 [Eumeta japonica]
MRGHKLNDNKSGQHRCPLMTAPTPFAALFNGDLIDRNYKQLVISRGSVQLPKADRRRYVFDVRFIAVTPHAAGYDLLLEARGYHVFGTLQSDSKGSVDLLNDARELIFVDNRSA